MAKETLVLIWKFLPYFIPSDLLPIVPAISSMVEDMQQAAYCLKHSKSLQKNEMKKLAEKIGTGNIYSSNHHL